MLMTPRDTAGISRLMQHLGRHYVLYINRQYRRTGTLWEGRHKASLVQADEYRLTRMRYMELNPVAAGMETTYPVARAALPLVGVCPPVPADRRTSSRVGAFRVQAPDNPQTHF